MSSFSRLWILSAACSITWAVNFMHDCPESLGKALRDNFDQSNPAFQQLLSTIHAAYSIPNVILPFFTGLAIQKYGESIIIVIVGLVVLTGQLLFTTAVSIRAQWLVVFGRFVLGSGSGGLAIITYDLIAANFGNYRMHMALATFLLFGRLGSATNFLVTQGLVQAVGIDLAIWIITLITVGVMSAGIVHCILHFPDDDDQKPPIHRSLTFAKRILPKRFWQLIAICILGYACVNTFTNTAVAFLNEWHFNYDTVRSTSVSLIVPIVSGILIPVIGIALEFTRLQPLQLLLGSFALMLLGHVLLFFVFLGPVLSLACLGAAFAAYVVSFWSDLLGCFVADEQADAVPLQENIPLHDDGDDEEDAAQEHPSSSTTAARSFAARASDLEPFNYSAIGIGLTLSVLNAVTAITPLILSAIKEKTGFGGVEATYTAFAVLGGFLAFRHYRGAAQS